MGWTGGAVPWRWWGLKCNPGPMTTKAWPLRAKDWPHFLNCDVIPEQTLRSDYISEDYILRLLSALVLPIPRQTDQPLFILIFVRGAARSIRHQLYRIDMSAATGKHEELFSFFC